MPSENGCDTANFLFEDVIWGGEGAPPAPKPNLVAVCESLTQSRASNGPLPNTLRPAPVLTTAGARAGSSRRPSRPEKTPPWTAATSRATPVGGTATPLCRAHTFMSPGRLVPAVVSGARAACSASKFGGMIVYAAKLLLIFLSYPYPREKLYRLLHNKLPLSSSLIMKATMFPM